MRRAAALLVCAAVLVACSNGSTAPVASHPRPTSARPPATTTTTLPAPVGPTYPLTGVPVDDPARAGRPVLAIKIDNAPEARPQVGLGAADVVIEELVEGGITRFMALYHSRDADPVGPLRSVRPVDPQLLAPLGGLFANGGGSPKFSLLARRLPNVQYLGADRLASPYWRDRARPRPNNQFTRTPALYALARPGLGPPPVLFGFLRPGEPFAGAPLSGVGVVMGERTATDWAWDPARHRWLRSTDGSPHLLADGEQLGADNVVLQFVYIHYTHDVDISGAQVPDSEVVGDGDVWILSQGRVLKGRWSKSNEAAVTTYTDAAGAPIRLTPGRSFVQLVPTIVTPAWRS